MDQPRDRSGAPAGGDDRVAAGGGDRVSAGGDDRVAAGGGDRVRAGGDDRVSAGADDHVVLRLAGSRCALPLDAVTEVGRPPGLTRVPGLPAWVAGLANWRGRVLAVVDLRPLLGAAGPAGRRPRLLVLARDGVEVGLLADAVEGTAPLPQVAAAPATGLTGDAAALLSGVATDAAGPVALLDVTAVLALADRLPRSRRAG